MIVDCFSYNGEKDLLDLRLNILDPYVDEFIVVEAPTTFTGKFKQLYFPEHRPLFDKWKDKLHYWVIKEKYTPEEIALAESSPNTQGAEHWKHEFLQKESIKKAIAHLDDDDTVFIGDVDEIWECDSMRFPVPTKLKLRVYTYYLDNRSDEQFWGTLAARYGDIKGECLNHLRSGSIKTPHYFGWHFTSMGGYEEVKRKLESSYTEESYWTEWVQANLNVNIRKRRDFLGRDFNYQIDTKDWPQYLKDNQRKYKHLLLDG